MAERGGESQRRSGGSSRSSSFPITGYGGLAAAQVQDRLDTLNAAELRKVRDHERRHAHRKTVLAPIESKLS